MKLHKYLLITALAAVTAAAHAQYVPKYFGDTSTPVSPFKVYGTLAKGNAFYMYAATKSPQQYLLNAIIKTDTAGNHLWTAYPYNYAYNDSLQFNGTRGSFQLITAQDNALYMLNACDSPYYFNSPGNIESVSKIDDSNGEVKWVRKLTDYDLDNRYLRITDYSPAELFVSSYRTSNSSLYSILTISKATGQTTATRNFTTGPANFDLPAGYAGTTGPTTQLYRAPNNNLYLFTSDSCAKYTSLSSTTPEWKIKFTYPYGAIRTAFEDNGLLYVCGHDRMFYDFGLIAAIDMATGTIAWQNRHGIPAEGVDDVEFCDAKIKNSRMYVTWKHKGTGSIQEKCYITCADKATGNINWQTNFSFNSDTTTGGGNEAMLSMEVDENETLYLTGYVPNPAYPTYDWGIMKINGITGQLLSKRRITKLVPNAYVEDKGLLIKQYGSNLYQAGYRTRSTSNYDDRTINLLRADTAALSVASIKTISGQIQYPSVTQGIRDFSAAKKLVVKNTGKSLVVEMTDNSLNTIWTKTLGNGIDYYEGTAAIGVNFSRRIFVAAKRFKVVSPDVWMLNEYHCPARTTQNDSTFIFELDSAGTLQRTYRYGDFGLLTPLRFVTDTPSTKTFFEYYQKNPVAGQNDNTYHYSFSPADGTWGTSWNANPEGRTPFLKPRHFYHLPGDTLLGFQTGNFSLGRVVKTRYLSGSQNFFSTLPGTRVIYDVEKTANNRYYLAGQDSLKRDFVMALNTWGVSQLWRNTFDTFQNTLKVMAIDTAIYTLVKRGRVYTVQCFAVTSGSLLWSSAVPVPVNHVLSVNDFTVNTSKKTITVLGAVKDTTGNFNHSTCWSYTFNANGSEYFRLAKNGSKMWLNEGTVLYVDRDNQTLAGGRIHYTPFGYAGFIMGADGAAGYYTINPGNWNDPAVWLGGIVPPPDAAVFIRHNIAVTADTVCRSIQVQQPGGSVNISTGVTLTITN